MIRRYFKGLLIMSKPISIGKPSLGTWKYEESLSRFVPSSNFVGAIGSTQDSRQNIG